jgi:hypothetical protein
MIMSLMTFLLSLVAVSLVALLSRFSARLAGPNLPETAVLRTAMKGATIATIIAMYAAHWLIDGNNWGAILAVSAGLLVMLVIWGKRRRLLVPRHADETSGP